MNNNIVLKQNLVEAAKMCRQSGLQTGNGGNLSVRIPNRDAMIVKASEVAFGDCQIDNLAIADFYGNLVEGTIKPSREGVLHGALYKALPQIGAIVHCHAPWATSWAATGKALPFATYHSAIKLYGDIRVFDTESYVVPNDFIPQILDIFVEQPKTKAFLLKKHGLVALGKDIKDALYNAELVEETAQIAVLESLLMK